ncbi:hypothetical protein FA95DRAFT_1652778, partial [Auriscalpium vulgare]
EHAAPAPPRNALHIPPPAHHLDRRRRVPPARVAQPLVRAQRAHAAARRRRAPPLRAHTLLCAPAACAREAAQRRELEPGRVFGFSFGGGDSLGERECGGGGGGGGGGVGVGEREAKRGAHGCVAGPGRGRRGRAHRGARVDIGVDVSVDGAGCGGERPVRAGGLRARTVLSAMWVGGWGGCAVRASLNGECAVWVWCVCW